VKYEKTATAMRLAALLGAASFVACSLAFPLGDYEAREPTDVGIGSDTNEASIDTNSNDASDVSDTSDTSVDVPLDTSVDSTADVTDTIDTAPDSVADTSDTSDAGPPSATYRKLILADGADAYWRLGEASTAVVAADVTGAHNGTYDSCVTRGVPGVFSDDTAARFSDTSGCAVTIADVFDFPGSASFSVEAWVKPDAAWVSSDPAYRGVIGKEFTSSSGVDGWSVQMKMGNGMGLFREQAGKPDDTVASLTTTAFPSTSYTHVVGIFDGTAGAMTLYVGGKKFGPTAASKILPGNSSALVLGGRTSGSGGAYNIWRGNLDEVAVYSKALTEAQVLAHLAAAK